MTSRKALKEGSSVGAVGQGCVPRLRASGFQRVKKGEKKKKNTTRLKRKTNKAVNYDVQNAGGKDNVRTTDPRANIDTVTRRQGQGWRVSLKPRTEQEEADSQLTALHFNPPNIVGMPRFSSSSAFLRLVKISRQSVTFLHLALVFSRGETELK